MSTFKRIISFGSSFVRDAIEHENPKRPNHNPSLLHIGKISFTRFLAEKMDLPFYNFGNGGASLYNAFRHFYLFLKHNPNLIEDTLFIWGFTFADRFGFPQPNEELKKDVLTYKVNGIDTGHEFNHVYVKKRKLPYSFQDMEQFAWIWDCSVQEATDVARFNTERIYDRGAFEEHMRMSIEVYQNYINSITENIIYINCVESNMGYIPHTYRFPNGETSWRDYIRGYDSIYRGEHPNADDHKRMSELLYTHIQEKFPEKIT